MNKEQTLNFIKTAHQDQWYGDQPYWTHPVAVAENLTDPTDEEYIAALLHDVIEDTDFGYTDLHELGFSDEIIKIVELLTKDESLSYFENIDRIISSGNRSAMKVKLSDNQINFTGDKSHMSPKRRDKLQAKYQESIALLTKALK